MMMVGDGDGFLFWWMCCVTVTAWFCSDGGGGSPSLELKLQTDSYTPSPVPFSPLLSSPVLSSPIQHPIPHPILPSPPHPLVHVAERREHVAHELARVVLAQREALLCAEVRVGVGLALHRESERGVWRCVCCG